MIIIYKKVYVEITNICNLSCNFCIKNDRKKEYISEEKFNIVLNKLKPFTKYLYFHILGEPLMHPNINLLIDKASIDFNVNITTNGYLIDKIKNSINIRQLNISLHSYDPRYNVSLGEYMNKILNAIDKLKKYTYISLRFWVKNEFTFEMIRIINNYFNANINLNDTLNNVKVGDNIFININKKFIWPDLSNDNYSERGTCKALSDHIGILVDGRVVPCCLDTKADIELGNIYINDIDDIIKSNKYCSMLHGFKNNKKIENLCRKCKFH